MRRTMVGLTAWLIVLVAPGAVLAEGYPWQSHGHPFAFLFENHIDTHQQSLLVGGGRLQGFFYIRFTGGARDGVPEAMHAECDLEPAACSVGWVLAGIPRQAVFVEHAAGQHPTWCLDPADLPAQPGYTHFHWLGGPDHAGGLIPGAAYDGMLLKLTAADSFFFVHHGGFLITPGIDAVSHANVVTDCP